MQSSKTTTRAFRIDTTVDNQLREWAEREEVSVSSLANKALRRLVEWDMYADRFGFTSLPREALARMINLLPDDEVRELGRWVGENVYRGFTRFVFKQVDRDSVLEVIPKLTSRYGKAFEYEEKQDGPRTVIVLGHGLGRKYSVYYEEVARALLVDFVGEGIRTEPQENAVVLEVLGANPAGSNGDAAFVSRRGP